MLLADGDGMPDIIKLLAGAGGAAVLAAITGLWLYGWIVTKSTYDKSEERTEQMRKERDKWEARALALLETTERLSQTADRSVNAAASAIGAIRDNGAPK